VAPLGSLVDAAFQVQIANAEAACMCLHHYDFIDGTSQLNPHGQAHLAKIVALLPRNFAPVTVEATGTAPLDDARRLAVFKQLSSSSFPIPYDRVVSVPSSTDGMTGAEAEKINEALLKHVELKGNVITTAGMSFGSSSGGSGGH
jgi:ABC-type hemin transport system ATPase subunit